MRTLGSVPFILVVSMALQHQVFSGGHEGPAPRPAPAKAQAIADHFLKQWIALRDTKNAGPQCVYRDRAFSLVRTGWYAAFDVDELEGSMYVSEAQSCVVLFYSLTDRMKLARYKGELAARQEQQRKEVERRSKFTLDLARENVQRLLAKVYPRFEERNFALTKEELQLSAGTACYRYSWVEAFDETAPKAFPNRIDVQVNPETGVVADYSAESYSFPEGFKLAMTGKQAVGRADGLLKEMLRSPRLRLVRGPTVRLRYLSAKDKQQRDRILWSVGYVFDDLDAPEPFREGFRHRSAGCTFDAATGERVQEHE